MNSILHFGIMRAMYGYRRVTALDFVIMAIVISIYMIEVIGLFNALLLMTGLLVLFLGIRHGIPYLWRKATELQGYANSRRNALRIAKPYLAPYKDIWKDLKLSNKNCSLYLGKDGITISCIEKISPYRSFKVISSHVHTYRDLWNMFCINFDYNKTYESLLQDCNLYKASVSEVYLRKNHRKINSQQVSAKQADQTEVELLDVNNCSEADLTALPGISIVTAKKIIKKREENGGFKSVDDFIQFMQFKPHIETQIREKITISKMKGAIKRVERSSERSVDL